MSVSKEISNETYELFGSFTLMKCSWKMIVLLAAFFSHYICASAAVAVLSLTPRNSTGNKDYEHWERTIENILSAKLRKIRSVHLVPPSSISFACTQLQISNPEALDADQARRLAEFLHANVVVWGTYTRELEMWKLSLHVVNLKTGEVHEDISAASSNWFEVVSVDTKQVLQLCGVVLTTQEQNELNRPYARSMDALKLMSEAVARLNDGESQEGELLLRRAVALEPTFYVAQNCLAQALLAQGKLTEAESFARTAIADNPDHAKSHQTLATILLAKNLTNGAEAELLEAIRAEATDPDSYLALAALYDQEGKKNGALSIITQAEEIAPHMPLVHAEAAFWNASSDRRKQALQELRMGELDSTGNNPKVEYLLAETCRLLNNVGRAIAHYEAFLAAAKESEMAPSDIKVGEERLAALKASQTVHFIVATPPADFSLKELSDLEAKVLSPEELDLVVDAFFCTEEMKKWAKEQVRSRTNQMEMARQLYEGLIRHHDGRFESGERTAAEAFKALGDTNASLTCQDYTLLYVALAQSLGLKAYYAFVEKDCCGDTVSHACAGIFVDGKALLVDPGYRWFGIPHLEFQFKDAYWVLASYLAASGDIKKVDVGVKLARREPDILFYSACNLAIEGSLAKAQTTIDMALQQQASSWLAFSSEACLEACQKHWNNAIALLQKSLQLSPNNAGAHFNLGIAFQHAGLFKQARDEYQSSLAGELDDRSATDARQAIEQIDDLLKSEKSD